MKRGLWLFAFTSLAVSQETLDEEWVKKDVAVARRIAAALPASETRVEEFLARLDASSTEEDRDIGFGARRLRLALYGGYTTTWVTVIAWDGGVGPVEVLCHEGDAEVWAGLRDRIAVEYKARSAARTGSPPPLPIPRW